MKKRFNLYRFVVLFLLSISVLIPSLGYSAVSPNSLTISMTQGDTTWSLITVYRSDSGTDSGPWSLWNYQNKPGQATASTVTTTHTAGHWLYQWDDNKSEPGVSFQWEDILTTGSQLTTLLDDEISEAQPLGFEFPFYGQNYSSVYVSANGWISFLPASGTVHENKELPSYSAPSAFIAVLWDDLEPQVGGTVWYSANTERAVITWSDVPTFASASTRFTFQAILYPSGEIKLQYSSVTGSGTLSHTIGMQDELRQDAVELVYNESYIKSGLSVILYPSVEWLSIEPGNGTLAPSSFSEVTVWIKGESLYPGVTTAWLNYQTGISGDSSQFIPVQVNVQAGASQFDYNTTACNLGEVYSGRTVESIFRLGNAGYGVITCHILGTEGSFTTIGTGLGLYPQRTWDVLTIRGWTDTLGPQTGSLILSLDTGAGYSTLTVGLSLKGVTPPSISLSSTLFNLTLRQGEIGYAQLTVYNNGATSGGLNYQILETLKSPEAAASIKSLTASKTIYPEITESSFKIIPGMDYVSDEVIVKFKSTRGKEVSISAMSGKRKVKSFPLIGADLYQLDSTVSMEQALADLAARGDVEYAEPNYIAHAARIPNDPSYSLQWGLATVGAPAAWDVITGSEDIIIAVVDSGVDYTHPDLSSRMWQNTGEIAGNGIDDDGNGYIDDVRGWNFLSRTNDPMDDYEHGTHVAGIAAAATDNLTGISGMTWKNKVMALKFLGSSGTGPISLSIEAVQYAVKNGAKIINNSYTGGGFLRSMYSTISAANEAGVLMICAAGNEYNNNDSNPSYPANYGLPNVISVGATDSTDGWAAFSNYGNTVHIAAPGKDILSTIPSNRYVTRNGTSMAAPMVSGAAALLLGLNPQMTAAEVRTLLLNSVDIRSSLYGKVSTSGRLNVQKALEQAGISWLEETPRSGTIPASGFSVVTLRFDATYLPVGDTTGHLIIESNDTVNPRLNIQVGLTVTLGDPNLSVSANPVDFGQVRLGTYAIQTLILTQSGYSELTIQSLGLPKHFSVDALAIKVLTRYESWEIPIRFDAVTSASYSETAYFETNDPDQPSLSVVLNAVAAPSPVIDLQPSFVSASTDWATESYSVLTITNTVTEPSLPLNWNSVLSLTSTEHAGAASFGGPDGYQMRWVDSLQPNGPIYQWKDISTTGTRITGISDDSLTGPYDLGFSFPYYGKMYDKVYVGSNGYLVFVSSAVAIQPDVLPSTNAPATLLAPFWGDLNPATHGSVYYQGDSTTFTVSYVDIPLFDNDSSYYNFQVILKPEGDILYQYGSLTGSLNKVTVGLQDDTKTRGLTVVSEASYLRENLAIRFWKSPGFVDVSPTVGVCSTPGSYSIVTIHWDSRPLAPGVVTTAYLLTASNDLDRPVIVTPLTLQVTPGFTADFSATPLFGMSPLQVQFTGISAVTSLPWHWDFGDGYTGSGVTVQHSYSTPTGALYTVRAFAGTSFDCVTVTRVGYIRVVPNTVKTLGTLPGIKFLKGQSRDSVFSLNDYVNEQDLPWRWRYVNGSSQVQPYIASGSPWVGFNVPSPSTFVGIETVNYYVSGVLSAGLDQEVRYLDYILKPIPRILTDDGDVVENGTLNLSDYIEPGVPGSWPLPVIIPTVSDDSGKVEASINSNQLTVTVSSTLSQPVNIRLSVGESGLQDRQVVPVYELENIYGRLTSESDLSVWHPEGVNGWNGVPVVSWDSASDSMDGTMVLDFNSENQAVKFTLDTSLWQPVTTGQTWVVRMRIKTDIPDSDYSAQLLLFNGVPPAATDVSVMARLSISTSWQWMETEFTSRQSGSLYPQMIFSGSHSTGHLYIDDVQIYQGQSELNRMAGPVRVIEPAGDFDRPEDLSGWGVEPLDTTSSLPEVTGKYGYLELGFNGGVIPQDLKLTSQYSLGQPRTVSITPGTWAGMEASVTQSSGLTDGDNGVLLVVYGTDTEHSANIIELAGTGTLFRTSFSEPITLAYRSGQGWIYPQLLIKSRLSSVYQVKDLYLHTEPVGYNFYDTALMLE